MRKNEHELRWEDLPAGITAQPGFLRDGAARTLHAAATALPLGLPSRVYLVGCGDSHFAGLATRFAFERWSGIPTVALESLEFSRYAVEDAPRDALVVAVSNSGRVVRTLECARAARERGIPSIGLTHNPASRLADTASLLLPCPYEDLQFELDTLPYLAALTGLYALAVRLGELSGRLEQAAASRIVEAITAIGDNLTSTIEASHDMAGWVAANLPTTGLINVLGGGPNYGSALIGVAKFIHAAAYPAVALELEEWAHEQHYVTRPGTATLVVAPPGASVDRAREQLQAVRDVGGYAVAVCSVDDADTVAQAHAVLPVVTPADELLSPLVMPVPLELTALAFGRRLGRKVLGFDDQTTLFTSHQRLIYGRPEQGSPASV